MSYTIIDHIHNYAVWTAARAVQRNFTTTRNIKEAINHVGLKNMLYNNEYMTIEAFDTFHRATANGIMDFLADQGIITSYGQAAKIIAIYLKTAVVIKDSGISNISKIVHPPIDSILLGRLHTEHPELGVHKLKWTQLDEKAYFGLIEKLRTLNLNFFWELEKYWNPD